MKIQNGGYIRYTLKDTPHSQIYGIGPNYPSILNYEWLKQYEGLSFEIEGLFPFDGDGHWNICLDYRINKLEPQVTYIDTESDYEKEIANSFKEYLAQLEIVAKGYFIDTNEDIETIINKISIIASIKFNEPSNYAHGYLEYTSKLKDGWIWVSPNRTQSGFIRMDDKRYEELKSKMEKLSVRYPELPENSILIDISEEKEKKELFEKLNQNGVRIIELKKYIENNPNR